MANWFKSREEEEREAAEKAARDNIELKVPKDVTEKLNKIDKLETSMNEFTAKSAVLDEMSNFLKEQKDAKEAARVKAATEAAKVNTDDLNEQWMTDPAKAFNDQSKPLIIGQINTQSKLLRREIFDDGKEFEFYHGDFKKEVDDLIDNNLAVNARIDPKSIQNCYYLVLGRKQNEIKEGKLKSRFASTSTANAKSGDTNNSSADGITLTDQQKKAAERLGVKAEDYAKQVKEMNYV